MPSTVSEALIWSQEELAKAGITNNRFESRLLLQYITGISLEHIISNPEQRLTLEEEERFIASVSRRSLDEPISKIVGRKEFWSLSFAVNQYTLDPRPDSETLIEAVLKYYPSRNERLTMLDFGVGTGCLIISLLHEYPLSIGVGVDKSAQALQVACVNKERFNLSNRLFFIQTSWGNGITGSFNVIISNPPYIPEVDKLKLSRDVREYDPEMALFGGSDGLDAYRELASALYRLLHANGHVFLEIGYGQQDSVERIMVENGFINKEWIPDLCGIIRCGVFIKPFNNT